MSGSDRVRGPISTVLLTAVLLAPASTFAQEIEKGRIVEKVICSAAPDQSYALFLPSSFDSSKKYPVLFLFDPAARGALAVEAFRAAAESFGWILVGSNNAQNGPQKENARAALAVWTDFRGRFPLDERRVYASGFSGGARSASVFPPVIGRAIAGVIGCGAGLSPTVKAGDLKAEAYFGLVGLADFNYAEMKRLDLAFDSSGLAHRFLYFEGRHDWPDPASCAYAVGWMEVAAMKTGHRPTEDKLAGDVIHRELEAGRMLQEAGRIYWAVDRLATAAFLAEGILEIPDLAARIEGLKTGKEYGKFLIDERKRDLREAEFQTSFGPAFAALEGRSEAGEEGEVRADVRSILSEMGIARLQKEARQAETIENRSLAARLLFELSFTAQTRGTEFYTADNLKLAAVYLDLAIGAVEPGLPREKYIYFDRAVVAVRAGEKKKALDFLGTAVDKGFSSVELLEKAKEWDPVRDSARFREILDKARKLQKSP
jgi:predicted esterase